MKRVLRKHKSVPITTLQPRSIVVLGMILVGIGVLVSSISFSGWLTYFRASGWTSVSGQLVSANLKVESSPGSRARYYGLETCYRFPWQDREILASRTFPTDELSGATRADEFYREQLRILDQTLLASGPVTILVNPDDPNETLLLRLVCPGMVLSLIFGSLFLTVGSFIFLGGFFPAFGLIDGPDNEEEDLTGEEKGDEKTGSTGQ